MKKNSTPEKATSTKLPAKLVLPAVFYLTNSGKIKITHEAMVRMATYAQCEKTADEAGGVLLGRFIKESNDIIVDNITVPMIGDLRSRFSFKRGKALHQRIIDRIWQKSRGTSQYLGEWHTHPEKNPSPSIVDTNNWKRQLKEDTFSNRFLYFIILGTEDLGIWEGDKETLQIRKLKREY